MEREEFVAAARRAKEPGDGSGRQVMTGADATGWMAAQGGHDG